ncbi:unnamed protein product, partial [marine sediment metagenome]
MKTETRGRKALAPGREMIRKTYRLPKALSDFIAFRAGERDED